MAAAPTTLLGSASATPFGTAAYSTAEFTPSANSLLVVAVMHQSQGEAGDLGTPTISGGGLTYTKRLDLTLEPAWAVKVTVFTAPVGGSPTKFKLTVDDNNNQNIAGYVVSVVGVTGYDAESPIGGTLSTLKEDILDGAESRELSAAPAAGDLTLLYVYPEGSSQPPETTLAATWTKVHELGQTGDNPALTVARRESSTSKTVAVTDVYTGGGVFYKAGMMALVIKAAPESEDVTISVPAATATAAGIAPTPTVGIAAVVAPAVASASPPAPTLTIVAPPAAATAAASAPAPAVAIGTAPASAAAAAPSPVPAVAPGVPAAQATAGAPAPSPAVSVGLAPAAAVASAPSPVPAVLIGAPPALATASAPAPTVVVGEAPAIPLDLDVPTKLILKGTRARLALADPGAGLTTADAGANLRVEATAATVALEETAATVAVSEQTNTVVLDDPREELILDG